MTSEAEPAARAGSVVHVPPRPIGATGRPAKRAIRRVSRVGAIVYVDRRPLTRECLSRWMTASLRDFAVLSYADLESLQARRDGDDEVRLVVVHGGNEGVGAGPVGAIVAGAQRRWPEAPCVLLTYRNTPENLNGALALGLRGFIPMDVTPAVAVKALRLILAGGSYVPAGMLAAGRSAGDPPNQPHATMEMVEGFTPREGDILRCIRRGLANKRIAYELGLSESTVKVHVRNIMKKLKATNRTQVVFLTRDLTGFDEPAGTA